VIRHTEGNRISLGEPDGSRSERCRAIAEALVQSGLRCPVTTRLRTEIWVKLLGNVAFNPISALARATLGQMARDADVRAIVRNIMAEVEAVANKLGVSFPFRLSSALQAPGKGWGA
jgi:2-dehydropantoate 2-reductase